ncbi:MAG: hypothetical protein ACYTGL_03575 [Planctomycetota bacterium]|jgi:hypothetical protein
MKRWPISFSPSATACSLLMLVCGCSHATKCDYMGDITPNPIGTLVDPVFQAQEANAEAADFVVHEHEWVGNSATLNERGKDHVQSIAARANSQDFPIVIEESSRSTRPDTQYQYPVHNNDQLDSHRRAMLVEALTIMGVADAEDRVVVGHDFVHGFWNAEANRALQQGFNNQGGAGGGGGGGGGF